MPGENIHDWSTTAANNGNADSLIIWQEGQPRASVNNSARSMMAAHAKQRNLFNGSIITTGSVNAQNFVSGLGYATVPIGLFARLKIGTLLTNTGPTTLNVDSAGPVAIKNQLGEDIGAGALLEGSYVDVLYDGTNWVLLANFQAAAISSSVTTGDIKLTYKAVADDGWIIADDGSIGDATSGATTRANADTVDLFKLFYDNIGQSVGSTCTITIATPAVVTVAAGHGLAINQDVVFSTTGALPTGIIVGATYYVLAAGFTATSFRIATTIAGGEIATSGTQSGTHTVTTAFKLVLQDTAGTTVQRGANATADYASHHRLVIPKVLGRALAGAGAGTGLTNRAVGNAIGEETHIQTVAELATHTHGGGGLAAGTLGGIYGFGSGANFNGVDTAGGSIPLGGGSAGLSTPFNIMQPTSFINVMIKL